MMKPGSRHLLSRGAGGGHGRGPIAGLVAAAGTTVAAGADRILKKRALSIRPGIAMR